MPDSVKDREAAARTELLESYADLDDHLMEELIEDHQPLAERGLCRRGQGAARQCGDRMLHRIGQQGAWHHPADEIAAP
jgi:hypothetical protein